MSEQVVRPQRARASKSTPDQARSVRKDPQRSHIDGMREGRLSGDGYRPIGSNGGRDEFHYVWVNMAAQLRGPEYYQMLGYVPIRKDDGITVSGRGTYVDGVLTFLGHVLMACPKERHDEIVQFGPGGDTGLENTAKIERQIVRKQSLGRDSLRGMGARRDHLRVVDDAPEPMVMDEEEA